MHLCGNYDWFVVDFVLVDGWVYLVSDNNFEVCLCAWILADGVGGVETFHNSLRLIHTQVINCALDLSLYLSLSVCLSVCLSVQFTSVEILTDE